MRTPNRYKSLLTPAAHTHGSRKHASTPTATAGLGNMNASQSSPVNQRQKGNQTMSVRRLPKVRIQEERREQKLRAHAGTIHLEEVI
mmetsp:Transcript_18961/g.38318  ORF Transcript_18961/g.38318 Transcript_18961/m.38318 type:complete len:87 (+) Transcript_18961:992-1252(+)